jgi:hypothetical protein
LVVGNIHNISSAADFTIFEYISCALVELGITSISAKSTPASISLILFIEVSVAATPPLLLLSSSVAPPWVNVSLELPLLLPSVLPLSPPTPPLL